MSAKEDYLRIIYELGGEKVKSIDIAKKLGISKPSVSEMLKKLAKDKLIESESYGKIFLTKEGIKEAKKIADRHHIIKKFARHILKHKEDKVHDIAHKLEHHFSPESIKKLESWLDKNLDKLEALEAIEKPSLPSYIG